jgi:hypothetical protein
MLNRTLVLPTSWCWCDYDWTPHVLERCKIRGSDLQLPFECPADFLFSLPRMEESGVDYRVAGFLDNPQVHAAAVAMAVAAPVAMASPVGRAVAVGGACGCCWPFE